MSETRRRTFCGSPEHALNRRGFLGSVARSPGQEPLPVDDRLPASLATATWALERGARMVRVHDVAATVQAARLVGPDRSGSGW